MPPSQPPGVEAPDAPGAARTDEQQKLRQACEQFESLFLAQLLKVMRRTTETLGSQDSMAGAGLMSELADEHLAEAIARGRGLGIAEMLRRQLEGGAPDRGSEGVQLDSRPIGRLPIPRWERMPEAEKIDPAASERVDTYGDIIHRAAERYDLSPELLRAVIAQESGGRPGAVSEKGAKGLMQLMDETARDMGVRNPHDPEDNILGGARYLRELLDRWGGDLERALAAYNAGPSVVERHGGIPPFRETENYVRRILGRIRSSTDEAPLPGRASGSDRSEAF
jgi:soluble lytic murein transglycosylase-like protein